MKSTFITIRVAEQEKAILQRLAGMNRRTLSEEIMFLIERALGRPIQQIRKGGKNDAEN